MARKAKRRIEKKHLGILLVIMGFVLSLSFLVLQSSRRSTIQAANPKVGIIGDSNSDEYRADDNRAGSSIYADTTLSWGELLTNFRGFDFGPWGTWGGERRSGYKNNWARSAATTASMIANGQHTGLAQQITAGEVDYAYIYIGTNDFHSWNGTYDEVYNGTLTNTQLQNKVNSIISNITLAVDTLKAAGPVKIVLVNFADPGTSADFMQRYPDATKRQRVSDAIIQINQGLSALASSRTLVLADLGTFTSSVLSRIDSSGNIIVAGQSISAVIHGDEPHHLQLGDSVGHIGTVGSGLMANFLGGALSTGYGLGITPFTDQEIVTNAGIVLPTTPPVPTVTPTPTPIPTVVPTATPIPIPVPTVAPTATPVPTPTKTPTPVPTPTTTPTPVPTATPTLVPTPPTGSKTITFDDLSNPNRNLNGQYPTSVINWGTNQWFLSGPWVKFTTNSISFSTNVTSKTFSFVTAKKLVSVIAYNGGSGSTNVTLACAGNTTKQQTLTAGQVATITTGWATACTTVTVGSTNGWWTNFDSIVYQ